MRGIRRGGRTDPRPDLIARLVDDGMKHLRTSGADHLELAEQAAEFLVLVANQLRGFIQGSNSGFHAHARCKAYAGGGTVLWKDGLALSRPKSSAVRGY